MRWSSRLTLTHVNNVYYSMPQVTLGKRLMECSFADQFIAFTHSFHGTTMGSVALTRKEHYRLPFEPVMPGIKFIEHGNFEEAKKAIQHGKTAAVFIEPIQGEGGIYSATKDFLQALRAACDDAGALLVFDEVQCGLGRTGHLMTIAEPLAGGLLISVVPTTERVAAAISAGDHNRKEHYWKELVVNKLGGNLRVKEVGGFGLIVGIELDVQASPLVDARRNASLLVLTAERS
ncbi:hypothetical protein OPV22_004699 [Ensete ventricosum]|uniref:Ornithine aminotransferase n=1 Tax=Ensete ventricosum TaxID=4639 RepID=A0AAV8RL56_ENSVE|nr:hypothetical protein OPV22_004699 [Ensete ventricosum]